MCGLVQHQGSRPVTRIIAALILILSFSVADAKPLSRGEFTAEFAAALRSELPNATVTVQADLELVIKNDQGSDSQAFLSNAYQDYLAGPPDRLAIILRRYIASIAEQQRFATMKLDRAHIVPVIKDRQWIAESLRKLAGRGLPRLPEYISEPYNEDLSVLYAEDTAQNIRYIEPKRLQEAGVARAELRTLAIANLKRLLPRMQIRSGPLVSMVMAGGDYEPSLLLFDDIWTKGEVPARVDGDVVVAIPRSGVLLFTGSRNRAGVARLRELATKVVNEGSHSLTDTLFVYRDGRFTRFGD